LQLGCPRMEFPEFDVFSTNSVYFSTSGNHEFEDNASNPWMSSSWLRGGEVTNDSWNVVFSRKIIEFEAVSSNSFNFPRIPCNVQRVRLLFKENSEFSYFSTKVLECHSSKFPRTKSTIVHEIRGQPLRRGKTTRATDVVDFPRISVFVHDSLFSSRNKRTRGQINEFQGQINEFEENKFYD